MGFLPRDATSEELLLRTGLLTRQDLAKLFNCHPSTIQRLQKSQKGFPAPIKIGRSVRWNPATVAAWIAEEQL